MNDSYLSMISLENSMAASILGGLTLGGTDTAAPGVEFSDVLDGAIGATSVDADTPADAAGMSASDNLVKFIENHEGFASTPYRGIDSWNETTGYGHVIEPGENIGTLTPQSAEDLLKSDLTTSEASVNKEFAGVDLTQGQFDALTDFAYSLGPNIWSETPKLVSDVKAGASSDVIKADFENCSSCGGKVVQGLVNRRLDEWNVYENGDYGD